MRDIFWSILICFAATFLMQCQPTWSARRFVQDEAKAGFDEAYAGYRLADGQLVTAPNRKGARANPLAPMITFHRVEIIAERTNWNGKKVELVIRHRIELDGNDASREIHVQLARENGDWLYTLFEVRGLGELSDPNAKDDNPFARALQQS